MWELWMCRLWPAHSAIVHSTPDFEAQVHCSDCSNEGLECGWLLPSVDYVLWSVHFPSTFQHPAVSALANVLLCLTCWGGVYWLRYCTTPVLSVGEGMLWITLTLARSTHRPSPVATYMYAIMNTSICLSLSFSMLSLRFCWLLYRWTFCVCTRLL